jgi:hypothetical protein
MGIAMSRVVLLFFALGDFSVVVVVVLLKTVCACGNQSGIKPRFVVLWNEEAKEPPVNSKAWTSLFC